MQKTKSCHQNRAVCHDPMRKSQIIFAKFKIVSTGRILSCVGNKQSGNTIHILIFFVHRKGFRNPACKFVIQTCRIIQPFNLVRGPFPVKPLLHGNTHFPSAFPNTICPADIKKIAGKLCFCNQLLYIISPCKHGSQLQSKRLCNRNIHEEIL